MTHALENTAPKIKTLITNGSNPSSGRITLYVDDDADDSAGCNGMLILSPSYKSVTHAHQTCYLS
jgi:hypothetical protein